MATKRFDQSQPHLIGSSTENDSFIFVLLPPTNSLEKKRREKEQSWQRVKAIKLSQEIPFEDVKKIIYFFSCFIFSITIYAQELNTLLRRAMEEK